MAICLAQKNKRCVAVDLDLGGANLHTILGIPAPDTTLADFISKRFESLSDVFTSTSVPDLWLISGSRALLEMANPKYFQKVKLIRHLQNLDVDHVLLDLGSGSSFNTLDFFLAADKGVLIVLPEPTSVENAYHFMKAAFYRKLNKVARKEGVAEAIDRAMVEKVERGIQSPRTLIHSINETDPAAGDILRRESDAFHPGIIVNQTRKFDDQDLGKDIGRACNDYFGIEIEFLGSIEEDSAIRDSIRTKKSMMEAFPVSPFSTGIQRIVSNLLASKEADVAN